MASMASYIDAAGSLSELAVAPAALVSTPEKWLAFEKAWNACLETYRVSEFHMRDFAHSVGEYEGWKNDQPKRKRFLNNLLWIIETYIEYTSAEAVYIREYNECDRKFQLSELSRPYTLGCLAAAGHIFQWGKERNITPHEFVWLFEKGDTDQSDLRKRWDIAYPDGGVEPIFLKKKDRYPDPNICKRQRPFEAADFVAYENLKVHRLLEKSGDDLVYEDQLRKPMQRMRNLPGAENWGFFGEDAFARICDLNKVPLR